MESPKATEGTPQYSVRLLHWGILPSNNCRGWETDSVSTAKERCTAIRAQGLTNTVKRPLELPSMPIKSYTTVLYSSFRAETMGPDGRGSVRAPQTPVIQKRGGIRSGNHFLRNAFRWGPFLPRGERGNFLRNAIRWGPFLPRAERGNFLRDPVR